MAATKVFVLLAMRSGVSDVSAEAAASLSVSALMTAKGEAVPLPVTNTAMGLGSDLTAVCSTSRLAGWLNDGAAGTIDRQRIIATVERNSRVRETTIFFNACMKVR